MASEMPVNYSIELPTCDVASRRTFFTVSGRPSALFAVTDSSERTPQMNYCDITLPTAEENLACDEALLDLCEEGLPNDVLRFWEPSQYFVVLGYANKVVEEARREFCEFNGIPVLRRCTGGGAVLQGPGVLNYSLVLRAEGELHSIPSTNNFILKRHQTALAAILNAPVEIQGHTDLAIGSLKFSGNSQRRKKRFLLFHGSILLHLDIDLVEKALPFPSRQPDYRFGRSHSDFLLNLKVPSELIKNTLRKIWNANRQLDEFPIQQIALLAREKYSQPGWNLKF
jgi:lipoate-protein ligase A